jgi:selenide,water dikinase
VGILSAGLKKDKLSAAGYAQMIALTTQLNTPGMSLARLPGVHAMTDVTGFGLAGHLLEICRGSRLGARLRFDRLPIIDEALAWAREGTKTGASDRNWSGYGHEVRLPAGTPDWQRVLITDPQTSGGLLVACSADTEAQVLAQFKLQGFDAACRIGQMVAGQGVNFE